MTSEPLPGRSPSTDAESPWLNTSLLRVALPIRCEPIAGETFASLAMRLAKANGLSSAAELWSDEQPPGFLQGPTPPVIAQLVIMSGLKAQVVCSMAAHWSRRDEFRYQDPRRHSAELSGETFGLDDLALWRRACPACVAQLPHERLAWTVTAVVGCTKHDLRFATKCTCGRKLDWSGWLDLCPYCRAPVGALAAAPMTPEDRAVSEYVEARLAGGRGREGADRLDRLPLAAAFSLMRWTGVLFWNMGQGREPEDFYVRGFAALTGPRRVLMDRVKSHGGHLIHVGRAAQLASPKVGRGRLQPVLPGLDPGGAEEIAALVREAAAG